MSGPAVVALGGGHGLAASLEALKLVCDDITAVVTVADNGGSSGRLRDEFDVLPPGDLRMALAALCDGRRFVVPLLAVTSPQVKPDADRMGLTAQIEAAGGTVLAGMCFYQSYAREIAEANGWKRLVTNSAKMVNILGGYGYQPMLASMPQCVDAACTGRLS